MQVFTPSKGAKVLILFLFFHILSICFKSSICVYDMKFYEWIVLMINTKWDFKQFLVFKLKLTILDYYLMAAR